MTRYDVFNGDADGLCALQQLHLSEPEAEHAILITGTKREIALLQQVPAEAGDQITVLDVSLDKNRGALMELLERGVSVRYVDHHYPGEIPEHPNLQTHIDTTADRGTSLLVDDLLEGRQRAWAVVGTFGDNFDAAAIRAAAPLGLQQDALKRLRELGILLNYNGYGATVADLHFPPEALFARLRPYADPLEFVRCDQAFEALRTGYADDMARARAMSPEHQNATHLLMVLPAAPWARRVGGVFANELAQQAPSRAHALLTQLEQGGFVVSVRAPIDRPDGADALCRQFETGGGRKAAAGINQLSDSDYPRFVEAFLAAFDTD
ncbi:acetyltransferase [Lamprobacter modestohalophilus]|uniref:Acetyltransferase n=1 Tax=Lamprobacter modestohalophilus TaxID=1064514 RepID=A0A9X0WDC3_9GAMM|nr:acetyltransferase [Lamprobacter modestohalophilus]MBK1621384.1 acetyltransferase [Lamprobacter modestohalophilus]